MKALLLLAGWLLIAAPAGAAQATSCTACHSDPSRGGEPQWAQIVTEFQKKDVHASAGLSCHDCHGGNPDPALADSPQAAMNPSDPDHPFGGVPSRAEIPQACGGCHSNTDYMEDFDPGEPVDQLLEYWRSRHGALLREGDEHVPTCVGCHGVHGILDTSDPESPVFPTKVAETCGHCHADPAMMAGYTLASGKPLPVDQYAHWRESVHAAALLERGDLSAPTCNDCHGSHGAAPPGLSSPIFACGQCHGREDELFRASAKYAGFEQHNLYLAEATCGDCHTAEPMAGVEDIHHFRACATCHDNHAVLHPAITMLGPLPDTPCAYCHDSAAKALLPRSEAGRVQTRFESLRDTLLQEAQSKGLSGEARFDWLVAKTTTLAPHTEEARDGSTVLRPQFKELFQKFRIGPTRFTHPDPVTGEPASHSLRRCVVCHGPTADLASAPVGFETSTAFLQQMEGLTVLIAQADRALLAAQRGGVEVREAHGNLDAAIDAQIQLSALVHGFTAAEGSPFATTHAEGLEQAKLALDKGNEALREIGYRRQGLAISLVVILLVLVGLGAKIRQLSRRRADEEGEAPR